jgi:hypothetical protein
MERQCLVERRSSEAMARLDDAIAEHMPPPCPSYEREAYPWPICIR